MTTSPDARLHAAVPAQLRQLNELPPDTACEQLLACCRAPGWARQVAAGRPYQTLDAVLRRSDAAVAALTANELREALAGHPRIGDHADSRSRREQSGVAGSSEAVRRALADGNAAYEQRFGHIYLACATGRSGTELLEFLRRRLKNSPETEWLVVASELAKINQIRLRALLAGQP